MNRQAFTYRGARRSAARRKKMIWRELPRYADKQTGAITVGVPLMAMLKSRRSVSA